jgi:uncharacterized membrane protein YbjE (DUF340 family)
MWLIILSLTAGCIVGASGMVPAACFRHLSKMITIVLICMLAALGAQIGNNAELLTNLPVLGWRALLIAVCSVAGSVTALWLLERWLGGVTSKRGEA